MDKLRLCNDTHIRILCCYFEFLQTFFPLLYPIIIYNTMWIEHIFLCVCVCVCARFCRHQGEFTQLHVFSRQVFIAIFFVAGKKTQLFFKIDRKILIEFLMWFIGCKIRKAYQMYPNPWWWSWPWTCLLCTGSFQSE